MTDQLPYYENNEQFAWDSTSLKSAAKCPRYYQYKHIEGWQPKEKSVHLAFGGWYATALEHYHKHIAEGIDREQAIFLIIKEVLIATWEFEKDADGNDIPDSGQPWDLEHNTKTRINLVRTIIWYLEHFKDDPLKTYITESGEAGVEYSFRLPVDDDIILCGHIDRLAIDEHKHIYITDQKTTGSTISPYFFKGFKPDTQMTLYPFAGQMIYSLPIKGVIIDGAQIAVGFSRFGRAPILTTEDELDEWYEETMYLIKSIRDMTKSNYFPRNFSSCGNYGGCEFREVCSVPKSLRNNFLKADFNIEERWNPLRSR